MNKNEELEKIDYQEEIKNLQETIGLVERIKKSAHKLDSKDITKSSESCEELLETYEMAYQRMEEIFEQLPKDAIGFELEQYHFFLKALISRLNICLRVLRKKLEDFKICSKCGHKHKNLVDICEECGSELHLSPSKLY